MQTCGEHGGMYRYIYMSYHIDVYYKYVFSAELSSTVSPQHVPSSTIIVIRSDNKPIISIV